MPVVSGSAIRYRIRSTPALTDPGVSAYRLAQRIVLRHLGTKLACAPTAIWHRYFPGDGVNARSRWTPIASATAFERWQNWLLAGT